MSLAGFLFFQAPAERFLAGVNAAKCRRWRYGKISESGLPSYKSSCRTAPGVNAMTRLQANPRRRLRFGRGVQQCRTTLFFERVFAIGKGAVLA